MLTSCQWEHPRQGAAQYAADACQVPILNGGDGAGHHPTQGNFDSLLSDRLMVRLMGPKIVE